eukprot:635789-Pyramimonas_sp.AAC.1
MQACGRRPVIISSARHSRCQSQAASATLGSRTCRTAGNVGFVCRGVLALSSWGPWAARRMKSRAGLGGDRLTPIDFERLPDRALDELGRTFENIEATLTWPCND